MSQEETAPRNGKPAPGEEAEKTDAGSADVDPPSAESSAEPADETTEKAAAEPADETTEKAAGEPADEPAAPEATATSGGDGSDEPSELQAQRRRLAVFWFFSACMIFVLVVLHLGVAGLLEKNENSEDPFTPPPPPVPVPTLSASPSSTSDDEEDSVSRSKRPTNPADGEPCESVDSSVRPYKAGGAYVGGEFAVQVLDFDPNALERLKALEAPDYMLQLSKPSKFVGFKLRLTNKMMEPLNLEKMEILFMNLKTKCQGKMIVLHPNVKPGSLALERVLGPGRSAEGWIYFRMDEPFDQGKLYFDPRGVESRAFVPKIGVYEIDRVFRVA